MTTALLVGLGGFIGSASRYLISGAVQKYASNSWFPYGTMTVNILGCLIIGLLAGLAESRGIFTSESRAFVFIGVLGGFTTFSSFTYDTTSLIHNGQYIGAAVNVLTQVVIGLAATFIGYYVTARV